MLCLVFVLWSTLLFQSFLFPSLSLVTLHCPGFLLWPLFALPPYHWEGDYCAFGKLLLSSKVCRPDVMLLICRLFFPLSPNVTHTTCGLCCMVTAQFVPGGGLVHSLCSSPFALKPERNNFSCCLRFRQYRTRKVSQNSVDSYVS